MCNNIADQSLIVYWDVEVVAQVPLEIFLPLSCTTSAYVSTILMKRRSSTAWLEVNVACIRAGESLNTTMILAVCANQITPVISMTSGRGKRRVP